MPTIKNKKGEVIHTAASMSGMDLRDADFNELFEPVGSWKQNPDFRNLGFVGAALIRCNARGIRLNGADLEGVNFFGGNLKNAAFNGAKLKDTEFNQATIIGADFSGAQGIETADFRRAYYDATTKWPQGFTP